MAEPSPPSLGPRFEAAMNLALQLHRQQIRKLSNAPYISHLLSVTALVLQDGGSEDEAIAALLHDAVEDQGGEKTLAIIRQQFGDYVAELVAACSDTTEDPKPPWRQRKLDHIAHLKNASPSVHRIILADKLHNARSLLRDLRIRGEAIWPIFNGGKEGTLWYLRSLHTVLAEANQGYMIDELGSIINEIEGLASRVEPPQEKTT